jgi:hypothetical protein
MMRVACLASLHPCILTHHSIVIYKIRIYLKDASESERKLQHSRVQGRQTAENVFERPV